MRYIFIEYKEVFNLLKNKKAIIAIVIVGVVVLFAIIGAITSSKNVENVETPATSGGNTLAELYNEMRKEINDTEPNSSVRVDAIAHFAKKAATEGSTADSKDLCDEAIALITENYPDYFTSDDLMEKLMLCGFYLEYSSFAQNTSELGQDVEQVIKYVYRGAETLDSDSVKANLEQISRHID